MTHVRRGIRPTAAGIALLASAALLAGCDTGDGKDLKDFDPARYPSPTTTIVDEFSEFDEFDEPDDASGLADAASSPPAVAAEAFTVIAPWPDGGVIDAAYTCDGDNVAPALSWGAVPDGTAEIAIALVDDSTVNDGQPFVHWVIGGLDPNEIALADGDVPPGAMQALNFFGDVGYGGPCPTPGDEPHVYRLTAFALAQQLEIDNGALATRYLDVIAATAFASAEVTGTFQR